eukprot:152459_1
MYLFINSSACVIHMDAFRCLFYVHVCSLFLYSCVHVFPFTIFVYDYTKNNNKIRIAPSKFSIYISKTINMTPHTFHSSNSPSILIRTFCIINRMVYDVWCIIL